MKRGGWRHGKHWFMCVDDGELLFWDHRVASICDFGVHPKHPQKTHSTSGQPCLSSFMAIWTHQAQTTSLQHLGRAIAYVKSTSIALRVGNWNKSWPQCRFHSPS